MQKKATKSKELVNPLTIPSIHHSLREKLGSLLCILTLTQLLENMAKIVQTERVKNYCISVYAL